MFSFTQSKVCGVPTLASSEYCSSNDCCYVVENESIATLAPLPSGPAGSLGSPFFLSLYALDGLNEVRRCRDDGPGSSKDDKGHAHCKTLVFLESVSAFSSLSEALPYFTAASIWEQIVQGYISFSHSSTQRHARRIQPTSLAKVPALLTLHRSPSGIVQRSRSTPAMPTLISSSLLRSSSSLDHSLCTGYRL
jgi:hypothetical protein